MNKSLLIILVFIFIAHATFYGQSKQNQKAKVDSSLIYIDAAIKGIEKCCISILASNPFKYIMISSKYPMIIALNQLSDQSSINTDDYYQIGNFGKVQVQILKKTSLTAIGNVNIGMDFSSGSFNGGGYIESGEYEYKGGIIVNGKRISFESTKVRYEDDKGLCKINDGAKCIIDGKEYYTKGDIWINKLTN